MGNLKSSQANDQTLCEMPQSVRDLHSAVMLNDLNAVRLLVDQGVNVNFPWYNSSNPKVKRGSTPLLVAVSYNYREIVEVLLDASVYVNRCDRNGCTPVFKAAFHGRPGLIEILTRAGADVNLADFQGETPLYICVNNAVVHSCVAAVKKLLASGAIVDKCDKMGQAPIHAAAHWKLRDILQLLINRKSNVNIVDKNGRTPLYVCVSSLSTKLYVEDLRHQLPCIVTLFKAGADMLNLTEWLLYKGPGISEELLRSLAQDWDAEDFLVWYTLQVKQPQTLKNMCRKVIQKHICKRGRLTVLSHGLHLPPFLQQYISRKMFYRDNSAS